MPNFEVLVSKMMFDPEFARLMQTDPAAALKDLGIDPTPARLDAIKQVDIEFDNKGCSGDWYSKKQTDELVMGFLQTKPWPTGFDSLCQGDQKRTPLTPTETRPKTG